MIDQLRIPFAAVVLSAVLAACSTPAPRQVPTGERAGQGWLVTRAATALTLLQSCPPGGLADDMQDLYAPDRSTIDRLEADLSQLPAAVRQDDRQYVGVVTDGLKRIWVRGLPARDHRTEDPAREPVASCTEGWEALYTPSTRQFDGFRHLVPATTP